MKRAVPCLNCFKTRLVKLNESIVNYQRRRPYCAKCQPLIRLQGNSGRPPNWKGGRKKNSKGYIQIFMDDVKKYVLEHRKIWVESNGLIPHGYVIHHINGIKDDNRLENLECLSKYEHDKMNQSLKSNHWNNRLKRVEALASNMAATGIYRYGPEVFEIIESIKPSERGELEITDVNKFYIKAGMAEVIELPGRWYDCGQFDTLLQVEKELLND